MDVERLLRPRSQDIEQEAGFVRRALGFIADILILDLIVTAPFAPLLTGLLSRAESTGFLGLSYTGAEIGAMATIFLIAYAYFALFEYLLGQTIGMMLMQVRTSSGLWQSLVRNSFLLPFFPFVVLWLIEPIAILFSRRGMLERLSNTRTVVRRRIVI